MLGPSTIRTRLVLLTVVPAVIVAAIFGGWLLKARLDELGRDFHDQGEAIARRLATAAEYAVRADNPPLIQATLRSALDEPEVASAEILRLDGTVLGSSSRPLTEGALGPARSFRSPILVANVRNDGGLTGTGTQPEGALPIGQAGVRLWETKLIEAQRKAWRDVLGLGLAILLAATALGLWQANRLARPLAALADTVRRIRLGDYQARVRPEGSGEVLALEQGINEMGKAIAQVQQTLADQVALATRELKEQRDAATGASTAKSRFLAAASHDLRQPMHALGLFCAALEQKVKDPEQKTLIGNIQNSLRSMEGLFDSLLDISRLDAGRVHAKLEPVPLYALAQSVALDYADAARDKGLRLRLRRSEAWVLADATLLRRVLMNLVANAIRYTRAGGVLIAARVRADHVLLQVFDTGIGISAAQQGAVFEEFIQIDNPERDRTKGLGLGLAIAQKSAQLMGTRIGLRSHEAKGSVFSLALPLVRPEATTPRRELTDPFSLLGRRVVLVEDDPAGRAALQALLENWGCVVKSAESVHDLNGDVGPSATGEAWVPDFVVSDYRLRGTETGTQAIQQIRAWTGKKTPALIVTGELEFAQVAQSGTEWLVLKKPVAAAQLRLAIMRVLRPAGEEAATG